MRSAEGALIRSFGCQLFLEVVIWNIHHHSADTAVFDGRLDRRPLSETSTEWTWRWRPLHWRRVLWLQSQENNLSVRILFIFGSFYSPDLICGLPQRSLAVCLKCLPLSNAYCCSQAHKQTPSQKVLSDANSPVYVYKKSLADARDPHAE